jgi:hypothetical protein
MFFTRLVWVCAALRPTLEILPNLKLTVRRDFRLGAHTYMSLGVAVQVSTNPGRWVTASPSSTDCTPTGLQLDCVLNGLVHEQLDRH